jgi:lipid II:glycine glycyltransferase (peptidoglycan interpeptide bridge formation enzyme)
VTHIAETSLTVEVGRLGDAAWNEVLAGFSDASIYQTLAYAESRGADESAEHLVVRQDGVPVAAAQVEIVRSPIPRVAIARVFWGPVWKPRGTQPSLAHAQAALKALRDEYGAKRRMVVRVVPRELSSWSAVQGLLAEGWRSRATGYRTILLDLPESADELRPALHQNWRRNLAKGLKAELDVVSATDDAAFEVFMDLYRAMRRRKVFDSTVDPAAFQRVQHRLPEDVRPRIFTASSGGRPVAAIICSLQGDTGIYLFGASADAALPLRASYAAHWRAIEWLIAEGAACYDLGGASPANAGTYQFKSGTGGCDVEFVGELEFATSSLGRTGVHVADVVRRRLRPIGRG